jgi:hypothetical protein
MACERVVIVIDRMLVICAVHVPVRNDVTVVSAMRVIENKAEIVVAAVSRSRLRCGNKHALEGKRHRGRHHDDDSHTLKKFASGEAQDAWLLDNVYMTIL